MPRCVVISRQVVVSGDDNTDGQYYIILSYDHRRSQEFCVGGGGDNRGAKGTEIETPLASREEG